MKMKNHSFSVLYIVVSFLTALADYCSVPRTSTNTVEATSIKMTWNNNWSSKNKYQTNEHENNQEMGAKSSFIKNMGKVHAQNSGSFKYLRKPKTIATWRGAGTLQTHLQCPNISTKKEHFFDIYNSILMIQITWMMKRFHTLYSSYSTLIRFWILYNENESTRQISIRYIFIANDRIFRSYFAGKDLNRLFFEFSKEMSVQMKFFIKWIQVIFFFYCAAVERNGVTR